MNWRTWSIWVLQLVTGVLRGESFCLARIVISMGMDMEKPYDSAIFHCRLTKERSRFKDELDTVKFICTDFWSSIYKKQIDNLRTNHQGTYVLQDNSFRFLVRLSTGRQYLEHAPKVWILIYQNIFLVFLKKEMHALIGA